MRDSVITTLPANDALASRISQEEYRVAGQISCHQPFMAPMNFSFRGRDDEIIAGVSGKKLGGSVEIDLLFVDPALRNHGIGKWLVNQVGDWGFKNGCSRISLWSGSFHTHKFYRHAGFTEYGCISDQPKGHNLYYFFRDTQQITSFDSGIDFRSEPDTFYGELLPYVQEHERQFLPRQADQWPERQIAFTLNQKSMREEFLAAACGLTLWDAFYCESLYVSKEAGKRDILKFAHGLADGCMDANLSAIRLNVFPWQSPSAFVEAGYTEVCALRTREGTALRHTLMKNLCP